jgi:hypothetical protein
VFGTLRQSEVACIFGTRLGPRHGRGRQEEFNRNIEALAKWIESTIQRVRSGVKNSRVIELHDTCHYVFIVDEALVVREMRKFLLDE